MNMFRDSRRSSRQLFVAAAILATLLAAILPACRSEDPEVLLAQARASHEVKILSMARHEGQVLLSLRITEENSPLALPCLTMDVLFLEERADGPRELARERIEADLEGLAEAGGTLELTWRLDIPELVSEAWQNVAPEAQTIEVVLHQPQPEGLGALCEAQAISDSAR